MAHTTSAATARLAIALLALPLGLGASPLAAQQRIDDRRQIAADASIRFTLTVPSAVVRVVGWERDSVTITGTAAPADQFGGGVTSTRTGAKFFLESPREGKGAGEPVRLELRVPARSRLWIKAGAADVDVSGVTGGLDVNIVGGRIRVTGAPRELTAEAMDGEIGIAGAPPWLRAKTAAGSIVLRGGGEDVGLTSVSGRLIVTGGAVTRGRFETVTGDIDFDAAVPRDGSLTFDTHSGAVRFRLPADAAADVDVATVGGTIDNQLTKARPATRRDMRGRELGLSVGGGGAHVTIRTFKGSVALRRS